MNPRNAVDRVHVARIDPGGLPVLVDRLVQKAHVVVDARERLVRRLQVRVERERAAVVRDRLIVGKSGLERPGQVPARQIRLREVWIERQRLVHFDARLGPPGPFRISLEPLSCISGGQSGMRAGEARIEPDRLLEQRETLLLFLPLQPIQLVGAAQIQVVGFEIRRGAPEARPQATLRDSATLREMSS